MNGDTITSCIIDAVQAKATFDSNGLAGEIADPIVLTKTQLGDAYGLKAYSPIGKEWDEQTAAFCQYITASVSIAVGDFMGLVEKAAN